MGDTIYRQAAIDDIARWSGYLDEDMILRIQTSIKKLPSAKPEIKPIIKTMFQSFPYCPKCNHYLITGDNYCSVCGRHIDWSEDDDTAD